MSDFALPPLALEWSRGFASLSPGQPPCPGLRPEEWRGTYERCSAFIDRFGATAAETGWDTLRLFGVSPVFGTAPGGVVRLPDAP